MSLELQSHESRQSESDREYDPPTKPSYDPDREIDIAYRDLNRAAVVSVIFGVVSIAALMFASLLVIPVAGMIVAAAALWQLSRPENEELGWPAAVAGMSLSGVMFVGGVSLAVYEYISELPPDCERISFFDLQPDPDHPELPIPPSALDLNGQKIFIKGYVYPGSQRTGIKKFILVPDMGTCCFGGQPKLTDMIEVTLKDPLRVNYSYYQRKLAGTLKVDKRLKPIDGLQGVYYQLEVYHVE